MTYQLCINDGDQTYQWWMNFLMSRSYDIEQDLNHYHANMVFLDGQCWSDIIEFESEAYAAWFLLRYS